MLYDRFQLLIDTSVVSEEERLLLRRILSRALHSKCKVDVVRSAETVTQLSLCDKRGDDEVTADDNTDFLLDVVRFLLFANNNI